MIIDTDCTSRRSLPTDPPDRRGYICTLPAHHDRRHEADGSQWLTGLLVVWSDGDQWAHEVKP